VTDATVLAEGAISAGPLSLLIIVLLAAVTVLLIRNMNARLKRLPPSFPDTPPRADDPEVPGQR
jgi:small-conductance mechanosensitive channel